MGSVICHLPVTITIRGNAGEQLLGEVARTLDDVIGARLDMAVRELTSQGLLPRSSVVAPEENARHEPPPFLPQLGGYVIPSYDGKGKTVVVPASEKAEAIGVELLEIPPEQVILGVDLPPAVPSAPTKRSKPGTRPAKGAKPSPAPVGVDIIAVSPESVDPRVHLPVVRREAVDPRKHADYIDNRLYKIAYGIYIGGYLLYCTSLGGIPLLVPENFVDLGQKSAVNVDDVIYPDYPTAKAKLPVDAPTPGSPTPVAYYWSPIGRVVLPTTFCPATTPYVVDVMWDVRRALAKYVERQLTPLAYGILLGAIFKAFVGVAVPAAGEEPVLPLARLLRPFRGRINVGGGFEPGSETATNLQPFLEGTGGPAAGTKVPNLVQGRFEDIAELFESGSAEEIFSHRLTFGTVDWPRAAGGAYRVVGSGGKLYLNVWATEEEAKLLVQLFSEAGFRNVTSVGSGPGTLITGLHP